MFRTTERHQAIGIAIVRIVVGAVFLAHGWQKFNQMGHTGVTQFFTQLGAPAPAASAWLIMFMEVIGGVALILGVLTRLAAIGLACDMIGAIILFHSKHGFFVPDGIEFVMTLLGALVGLAIAGSGAVSIDALISGREDRV